MTVNWAVNAICVPLYELVRYATGSFEWKCTGESLEVLVDAKKTQTYVNYDDLNDCKQ